MFHFQKLNPDSPRSWLRAAAENQAFSDLMENAKSNEEAIRSRFGNEPAAIYAYEFKSLHEVFAGNADNDVYGDDPMGEFMGANI